MAIETKDTDGNGWQSAAKFIHLKYHLSQFPEIQVEIFNGDLMKMYRSEILPNDGPLIENPEQAKGIVTEEVQAVLLRSWTSIAFHLRTSANSPSISTPTIIIFCRARTSYDFTRLYHTLVQKTMHLSSPIAFEILPGSIVLGFRLDGQFVDVSCYEEKHQQGASIGIMGGYDAGTLGGHVWLNQKGQAPISCFLTCSHVIRSNNPDVREEQDKNGMRLGQQDDLTAYTAVEYPSSKDYTETRELLEKDPRMAAELAHVNKLISNSIKGRVIAASGRRMTSDKRRLDWALVRNTPEITSTIRPLPRNLLSLKFRPGYNFTEDSSIRQFGTIKLGDWLAKKGRTSGWTIGEVNHMRRVWAWPEAGKICEEIEVFGLEGGFAYPGDSGSLVHNKAGELVGMLFAQDSPAHDYDIGMVSDMKDIQDDIKRMTHGFITLDP